MSYNYLIVETDDAVGLIQLNRPDAMNALSTALMIELGQALAEFEKDDIFDLAFVADLFDRYSSN